VYLTRLGKDKASLAIHFKHASSRTADACRQVLRLVRRIPCNPCGQAVCTCVRLISFVYIHVVFKYVICVYICYLYVTFYVLS